MTAGPHTRNIEATEPAGRGRNRAARNGREHLPHDTAAHTRITPDPTILDETAAGSTTMPSRPAARHDTASPS
ncbi:hypothetical protein GCM10009662_25500 [Catellatospora coxensis]|uniref:Uncharacterized protein n=1 Tax=Catellatospora coxensis TaxID=310354 RepID=A0A8J3L470_9ACTN|nr:hypothetical protein Cco03nite_81730 [Catellatospora coxensis]